MNDLYLIQLIDKLTAIYLMQGVQPSELADAIFDDPYTNMSLIKNMNYIEVVLSFKEQCDQTHNEHIRRVKYLYNHDRYLVQTSEAIDSKEFKVSWDREKTISRIVSDIEKRLKEIGYSSKEMKKILSTLPTPPQLTNISKLSLVS